MRRLLRIRLDAEKIKEWHGRMNIELANLNVRHASWPILSDLELNSSTSSTLISRLLN